MCTTSSGQRKPKRGQPYWCSGTRYRHIRANNKSANSKPIIAIVDDDSSVLKALGRLLNVAGFQVKTFSSAEACLAGLNETGFDCVITDLSMRDVDGFDLKVRLAELTPNTPVILLTGCGTPPTDARARGEGFSACLSKPCGASKLLPIIQKVVR